jgi:hypothetical protein
VLTATQNQEGDPIHGFEILQNPFGPTGKNPLVYQRRHQRFYELADESRMEENRRSLQIQLNPITILKRTILALAVFLISVTARLSDTPFFLP